MPFGGYSNLIISDFLVLTGFIHIDFGAAKINMERGGNPLFSIEIDWRGCAL